MSGRSDRDMEKPLRKRLFDGAEELSMDELAAVAGGARKPDTATGTGQYVEATCGYCGTKGRHLMTSGWSAECLSCGRTINLKAQG